jgi:hypothetical protein
MGEVNIKSTTVEKGLDLAKEFLSKLLGPAVSEQGEIWGDRVRLRRMKNQLEGLDDARKICEEKNIPLRQINLRVLFPYLEGIALEEDKSLRAIWANLLANYIDPARNLITHVYPDILRQLSTEEVEILKVMRGNRDRIFVIDGRVLTGAPNEPYVYLEQITNLMRLGIIEGIPQFKGGEPRHTSPTKVTSIEEIKIRQVSSNRYEITEFGQQFIEACTK